MDIMFTIVCMFISFYFTIFMMMFKVVLDDLHHHFMDSIFIFYFPNNDVFQLFLNISNIVSMHSIFSFFLFFQLHDFFSVSHHDVHFTHSITSLDFPMMMLLKIFNIASLNFVLFLFFFMILFPNCFSLSC